MKERVTKRNSGGAHFTHSGTSPTEMSQVWIAYTSECTVNFYAQCLVSEAENSENNIGQHTSLIPGEV